MGLLRLIYNGPAQGFYNIGIFPPLVDAIGDAIPVIDRSFSQTDRVWLFPDKGYLRYRRFFRGSDPIAYVSAFGKNPDVLAGVEQRIINEGRSFASLLREKGMRE